MVKFTTVLLIIVLIIKQKVLFIKCFKDYSNQNQTKELLENYDVHLKNVDQAREGY